MKRLLLFLTFLTPLFHSDPGQSAIWRKGKGFLLKGHHLGLTLNLDFSKSYLSGFLNFAARAPVARSLSDDLPLSEEVKFYLEMAKKTLSPTYFLLELDYYPLTSLASTLKKHHPSTYQSADLDSGSTQYNIFELMGSRYEQPYSLALFLGQILPFYVAQKSTPPGGKEMGKGKKSQLRQSGSAVMGHVLSASNRALLKMDPLKDKWFQYSYKVKGTNATKLAIKRWGFEVGYLWHSHPAFFDSIILKLSRDSATRNSENFFANLKTEYVLHIPTAKVFSEKKRYKLTNFQKLVLGRNFHFEKFILGLDIGVKWELFKDGPRSTFSETQLIIAPNISY